MPNILDKKTKSNNIVESIRSMIDGLETYTVQCGLIYMNSLLRSSILYAAETYHNLTESDLRKIESIEEDCLRQILKTDAKCPIPLLYLETHYLPARFFIWRMMANYLHYLLQQKPHSLLYKFFNAQLNNPIKGDWITTIKQIIFNINLNLSFSLVSPSIKM